MKKSFSLLALMLMLGVATVAQADGTGSIAGSSSDYNYNDNGYTYCEGCQEKPKCNKKVEVKEYKNPCGTCSFPVSVREKSSDCVERGN